MNQIKKIIVGGLISLPIISNAQFNQVGPPPFSYGRTNALIQKIGLGNFPNNASVQAKLHINQFLLANNPATNGLMFRTDGNENTVNQWQLFTGANAGSVTEKFRLFVPANSDDAVLSTVQNGAMLFASNGIQRMLINNGGIGSAAGRVAVGNNLPNNFTPQARLHLHQTANINTVRFTTDNMAAGTGFEVGYNAISNTTNQQYAEIHNRENTAIKFFTNDTERLVISSGGELIVNNLACTDCLVMSNQNGQLYTDNQIIKKLEDRITQLEQKLLELQNTLAEK